MKIKNLSIPMNETEMEYLEKIAGQECRTTKGQARYFLMTALGQLPERPGTPPVRNGKPVAGGVK